MSPNYSNVNQTLKNEKNILYVLTIILSFVLMIVFDVHPVLLAVVVAVFAIWLVTFIIAKRK